MIAIHKSTWGFSPDWIKYCEENSIAFKIVNCYDSDIINQIKGCKALLWHHHHSLTKDKLFARELLFAIEQSGIKVFPNFNTAWHFDDKLGQKYLLEAIEAPLVPTFTFYTKKDALNWIKNTSFPKVFKLRGGAGSNNVSLINNLSQAKSVINQAFGIGFSQYNRFNDIKENVRLLKLGKASFFTLLKSFRRFFFSTEFAKTHGREKGYLLFQEFIPNNKFDIRVITIGNKAFALKRTVRENDFRASGSGFIIYNKEEIDINCVKIAFETSKKLNAQVVAYDFVFDSVNNPLIVEINYGYAHKAYFDCPGYWDIGLEWHEEKFNSTNWIIDLILTENDKL